MATVSRGSKAAGGTDFTANTNALASEVNTDLNNLVDSHNNHDAGTSKHTVVSAENASSTVIIANNSTGTNNIMELRDNGTAVVTVADGGNVTATGKLLGPDGTAALPTYSFSTDATNGLYLDAADTLGLSAGGTKRAAVSTTAMTMAVPIAMGSNKITGLAAGTTSGEAVRYEQVGVREALVRASTGVLASTTSGTFADTGVTGSITPSATTSRVLVLVSINIRLDCDATEEMICDCNIVKDSTEVALFRRCFALKGNNNDSTQANVSFSYIDSPATTSATTYKVQFRRNAASAAGTISINVSAEENSHITLAEIK